MEQKKYLEPEKLLSLLKEVGDKDEHRSFHKDPKPDDYHNYDRFFLRAIKNNPELFGKILNGEEAVDAYARQYLKGIKKDLYDYVEEHLDDFDIEPSYYSPANIDPFVKNCPEEVEYDDGDIEKVVDELYLDYLEGAKDRIKYHIEKWNSEHPNDKVPLDLRSIDTFVVGPFADGDYDKYGEFDPLEWMDGINEYNNFGTFTTSGEVDWEQSPAAFIEWASNKLRKISDKKDMSVRRGWSEGDHFSNAVRYLQGSEDGRKFLAAVIDEAVKGGKSKESNPKSFEEAVSVMKSLRGNEAKSDVKYPSPESFKEAGSMEMRIPEDDRINRILGTSPTESYNRKWSRGNTKNLANNLTDDDKYYSLLAFLKNHENFPFLAFMNDDEKDDFEDELLDNARHWIRKGKKKKPYGLDPRSFDVLSFLLAENGITDALKDILPENSYLWDVVRVQNFKDKFYSPNSSVKSIDNSYKYDGPSDKVAEKLWNKSLEQMNSEAEELNPKNVMKFTDKKPSFRKGEAWKLYTDGVTNVIEEMQKLPYGDALRLLPKK